MTAVNGLHQDPKPAETPLRRCAHNIAAAVTVLLRPPRLHRPWGIAPRQIGVAVVVGLGALLLCMIFIDGASANAAQRLPRWVIWSFEQITDYGKSGWFLWPLGVLFLALAALPHGRLTRISQGVLAALMVRVGFLFLAIGAPSLFDTIIKRMIGRARPFTTGIADPFVFSPFKWTADYASLPSGHATTAFAVLAAFGTLWPRWRTIFLVYAVAIAISRVVVTAHYPSDVLAGGLVGAGGVVLVRRYFALRRLGFSLGPGNGIHQYPGPSLKRIKAVARELLAE